MDLEKIKVIGFDLDQTLYPKSKEIDNEIQKYIYEKISNFKNISLDKARELFNSYYKKLESGRQSLIEIGFNEENARNIVQEALENADIKKHLEPNPKLIDLLYELKDKYILDIITGSDKSNFETKIKALGIPLFLFNNIITGDVTKSNGDAYRKWLSKYPKFNPENFLYIGDRKITDIDMPNSLNIKGILVYSKENKVYSNYLEVKDILDIKKYLL